MAAVDDIDELLEQYNLALGEFYKGNAEPVQKLYSHRDEVTLAPPFGPPTHGWDEVASSMERGASQFRDGENVGFEIIERYVTSDLAYVVRVERAKTKVGSGEDVAPIALRACYELGRKSHRNADFTVSLVPSRSLFPAF